MDHRPYPKIPAVDFDAVPGGAWVATEKIHGANLVIATDGTLVRFGKRKRWLDDQDSFFGWQLLRGEVGAGVRRAWRALHAPGVLHVYGELFGGHYPHRDVPPAPGCAPVQTGIWYAPDVLFAAFDAVWEPANGEATFLSFTELATLTHDAGLGLVPQLARGSYATLRALPVRYPSRVASDRGLPRIDDNVAEGFVLKPDARLPPDARPAIKCKIPELDEAHFDEAQPWPDERFVSVDALISRAARLINPPRLASARSKIGDIAAALLADEVALDVRVDLAAVWPTAISALSTDDETRLHRALCTLALAALAIDPSASAHLGRGR